MPKLISELDLIATIALDDVVVINDTSDLSAATRTKKASVQQLSDALISTAGAIPAVAAPVLNAGIPVFSGTGGATLADSGQTVAGVLAAAAAASEAYTDALTAADVSALPAFGTTRAVTAHADVLESDNGNVIVADVTAGGITLNFPDALPVGMRVMVSRITDGSPSSAIVTLAGPSGTFVPNATLSTFFEVAWVTKLGGAPFHVWAVHTGLIAPSTTGVAAGAPVLFADASGRVMRAPTAPATHSTSTLTLSATRDQSHVIADMATIGAPLIVSIPDTLRPGFKTRIRKSGASHAITFAADAGLITPTFYGSDTATADGALLTIYVESASVALVRIEAVAP